MKSKLLCAGGSFAILCTAVAAEPITPALAEQSKAPIAMPELSLSAPELPKMAPLTAVSAVEEVAEKPLTLDDIRQSTKLAEQALNQALVKEDWAVVDAVLPIYRASPSADPILIDYAQGALLRMQRKHKQAIDIYRGLIAGHPDLTRIRLDLAIMLFEDKQYVAALDQFQRVRSSADAVPDMALINAYIKRIQQEQSWDFSFDVSYFNDDNINNASASKTIKFGNATLTKKAESLPQSERGINYNSSATRDFNISGSHYINVDASIFGRKAFVQRRFDDTSARVYLGYHYQDANIDAQLRPTLAIRYIGGKHYSNTVGLSADFSYWLNPQVRLNGSVGLEHTKEFDEIDHISSNLTSLSGGGLYAPSAQRYFYGGVMLSNDHVNNIAASSYTRVGGYAGWGEDWQHGISTRLSGNVARKRYHDFSRFQQDGDKREDLVYGAQLSIWHRDWHIWGVTPKLSFNYNAVDSNIPDYYSYDKRQVFLQFDKRF